MTGQKSNTEKRDGGNKGITSIGVIQLLAASIKNSNMNNFRLIILGFVLGLLSHHDLFACECYSLKRDSFVTVGLRNSDIVFLGELIKADSNNLDYSFRVLEIFKGNYKNRVIKGRVINTCSLFPNYKGLWIIYANFKKDSLINIGDCGPSISLNRPGGMIPPSPNYISNKKEIKALEWEIAVLEREIEAHANWYNDLYKLREFKQSNIKETPKAKFDYHLAILMISLILNVFMFIMIISRKK